VIRQCSVDDDVVNVCFVVQGRIFFIYDERAMRGFVRRYECFFSPEKILQHT